MDEERYDRTIDESPSDIGRDPRLFILAGLLGSIIALLGTITSTYLAFVLPIGSMPFAGLIVVISSIMSLARPIGAFLVILGIYGLSIQYGSSTLILVAILEAVLLILSEAANTYFIAIEPLETLVLVSLGFFAFSAVVSIIFGITLLRLRYRAPQPTVFTAYGLIGVIWPVSYFLISIFYVLQAFILSQAIALITGILAIILFLKEHQRGPIVLDDIDWVQSSQVWE
jgi:hypothetical protein